MRPEPDKWKGFIRRLSYYFTGIAIGLMVLGLFHLSKQREARLQEERAKQAQQAPKSPDTLFPPIPKAEPAQK
jgi:hypothetical protein